MWSHRPTGTIRGSERSSIGCWTGGWIRSPKPPGSRRTPSTSAPAAGSTAAGRRSSTVTRASCPPGAAPAARPAVSTGFSSLPPTSPCSPSTATSPSARIRRRTRSRPSPPRTSAGAGPSLPANTPHRDTGRGPSPCPPASGRCTAGCSIAGWTHPPYAERFAHKASAPIVAAAVQQRRDARQRSAARVERAGNAVSSISKYRGIGRPRLRLSSRGNQLNRSARVSRTASL